MKNVNDDVFDFSSLNSDDVIDAIQENSKACDELIRKSANLVINIEI